MAFVHRGSGWHPPMGLLKSIAPRSPGRRVGAYAVRFGSAAEKDLEGDWFSAATDFGAGAGNGAPTLLNHGRPVSAALAKFARVVGPTAKTEKDLSGIFAETTLDESDPFQAALLCLVEKGVLRWSSATTPTFLAKAPDGFIKRWIIVEFSFTAQPCEPRLPAIQLL